MKRLMNIEEAKVCHARGVSRRSEQVIYCLCLVLLETRVGIYFAHTHTYIHINLPVCASCSVMFGDSLILLLLSLSVILIKSHQGRAVIESSHLCSYTVITITMTPFDATLLIFSLCVAHSAALLCDEQMFF